MIEEWLFEFIKERELWQGHLKLPLGSTEAINLLLYVPSVFPFALHPLPPSLRMWGVCLCSPPHAVCLDRVATEK